MIVACARPLVRLALFVTVASTAACSVSASSSSSSGSGSSSAVPGGAGSTGRPAHHTGTGAGSSDPATAPGTPAAPPCVASLSDLPTLLFTGRVLIRLPKGLELVEQNPYFSQLAASPQSTSCGAPVKFASVGFFQQPAGASVTQVRDQLLELRGIPSESVTWAEEGARGLNYTGAYTATADAKTGAPPVRGWMVLREAPGDKHVYFALYETDEASWDAVRAVFQESGKTLLVKPRALQGPESITPPSKPEPEKPGPKSKTSGTLKSK